MNTARLPTLLALLLATTLSFPAAAKPAPGNYPVLSFKQYEPIEASLLTVKSVSHDVKMAGGSFQITSRWEISGTQDLTEILIGTDGRGAELGRIALDGTEAIAELVSGNERYVRIAIKDSKRLPHVLTITSTLPIEGSKENLQLLSTYLLPKPGRLVKKDGLQGWDLRALSRHSYGDPVLTKFKIKVENGWLAVGSSAIKKKTNTDYEFEPATTGRYALVIAPQGSWKEESCSVKGLACVLVSKTKGANLSGDFMRPLLAKVADHYRKRFGKVADHIVMVDSDWDAISGGLLGSNILGFFAKNSISADEQASFKESFGWAPQTSTSAYVVELYKSVKDPWQAYMTGMLAHELAHLYFGFGRTSERIVDLHELWFSLGMGLVYDEIVTKELTGHQDAFFAAVEENWRTKFAKNKAIDQRLIGPDTSKDEAHKLSRAHVYAHGKALAVLRSLREKIGSDKFDRAVAEYLRSGVGGYQAFRPKLLALTPKLPDYEQALGIQ